MLCKNQSVTHQAQRKGKKTKRNKKRWTHLITANLRSNIIQRLNNPQPQLLPLLSLLNSDVLDMPHETELMNKLALDNQAPRANDPIIAITHNEQVVLIIAGADPVEPRVPLLGADVADGCQDTEYVQVAPMVV